MPHIAQDDSELVLAALSGDRDAFGAIVSRYQSLICSLAYSATGNLSASEDLAQETFITAWKHLRHLRETGKLRAWLCGIARNRINNTLRREGREPLRDATPLDSAHDSFSTEPLPREQAISKEEETVLWNSLERIPQIYREPMILFYREHESIENVADALELTEDAVKQRLSRGRKLLATEVARFVEGALAKTNPGKAFTLAVMAALPAALTTSAKAATLGAAAKGTVAAKTAAGIGIFGSAIGVLVGLAAPWIQYRKFMERANTESQRADVKRHFLKFFGLLLGGMVGSGLFMGFGGKLVAKHAIVFVCGLFLMVILFLSAAIRIAISSRKMGHGFQSERAKINPSEKRDWEYRSRFKLLGLPLIHIRWTDCETKWSPIKAWIAMGDCAVGVLFACGGLAVAPLSIGGLAIGLFSFGGVGVGLFVFGGIAFGGWIFGGLAFGWQAFGGCAIAWNAAMGGMAIARDFASGGMAQASQANTEIASQ
ncbi:MAG TPA: sigma-70 family RNA polymerase sigma factor, partial [Verrucomicrobiae bacterium]|nr:sigma-70 family RNA polymerase sigma factor [Verrucomicrobiae bacterium]